MDEPVSFASQRLRFQATSAESNSRRLAPIWNWTPLRRESVQVLRSLDASHFSRR